MQDKSIKFFLCLIIILFTVNTCLAGEKTYTLKFSTVAGPQQPQSKGMEVFADNVNKLSSGKIKVKIFHSGQLANQQTEVIGVMRGSIDMAFSDPNTLAQFDKSIGIMGAAYLFRDINHLYRVMLGDIGKEYFERLARNQNIRPLDVWYLGTRQLNLRNKPVRTPDEMKGVKLRMPNSPLWIAMGKALGANPTPLGFGEIYLALKTGVVEGQENPLPATKTQNFCEITKYIILTNHQIGMIWPIINEKLWKDMPEQYRTWIIKALEIAREYQNRLVLESEAKLLRDFEKKYGMIIIHPDIEAFRKNARKVYAEFENEWGKGMYDKIYNMR
ncbi:MAG: sialic acid TRAP transporter substrate-binding protein SiaP [Nitrospirota bacterium]